MVLNTINKPTPGVEAFRVFNQGATGFVSLEANREDARNRANEFCASQEKSFRENYIVKKRNWEQKSQFYLFEKSHP